MRAASVLLFWFRNARLAEEARLQRIDLIRGYRLAMAAPAVPLFSAVRPRPRQK
jgi:hypothetical protein